MGRRAAEAHGKLGPKGSKDVAEATGAEGKDPAEGAAPETTRPELVTATDPNDAANARERAVMSGGPGGDAPAFSFEHDGKKFTTPEELNTYLKGVSDEIAELKAAREEPGTTVVAPVAAAAPAAVVETDPIADAMKDFNEDEFFKNPRAVMEKLLGKAVSLSDRQLTTKYVAQKNMENFWSAFYDGNKDLKGKDEVVNLVFNENMKTLGPMSMEKANTELGKMVRKKLVGWGMTTANPDPGKKPRTAVEGGDSPAVVTNSGSKERPAATAAAVVSTLSGTIKARQQQRRAAQTA